MKWRLEIRIFNGERYIRQINVALTRARHHLFIFGNKESLSQSNSDFADLIKHYDRSDDAEVIDEKSFQTF